VSPLTVAAAALVIGAIVGSIILPASAIFAIPLAVVALIAIGVAEFGRRAQATRRMHGFRDQAQAEKIDFTERDRETQYVPDRKPEEPAR
jgi:hypothetical protein